MINQRINITDFVSSSDNKHKDLFIYPQGFIYRNSRSSINCSP